MATKKTKTKPGVEKAQEALRAYVEARTAADAANQAEADAKADLTDALAGLEEGVVLPLEDGRKATATYVAPTRVTLDEKGLQEALPKAAWNRVTKRVLDKDLLEAEVAVGRVKAEVVAANSTITPTKPYPRVTIK